MKVMMLIFAGSTTVKIRAETRALVNVSYGFAYFCARSVQNLVE